MKQIELVGASNLSLEYFLSLIETLEELGHEKNKDTELEVWYDSKKDKVYTNNKTVERLYLIMIDLMDTVDITNFLEEECINCKPFMDEDSLCKNDDEQNCNDDILYE